VLTQFLVALELAERASKRKGPNSAELLTLALVFGLMLMVSGKAAGVFGESGRWC
jgi:hypothetical protein